MFKSNKVSIIRFFSTEQRTRDFSKKDEQRKFFDELAKKLNLRSQEDWYKLTYKDIVNNGGKSLVRKYNNSPGKAIKTILSEQHWEEWKFNQVPSNFWRDMSNHRAFMDSLFKALNYKTMDDWYQVTYNDFAKHGGESLLGYYYDYSPSKAVMTIYPEHNWIPWQFGKVQRFYWDDESNVKELLKWVSENLNIKKPEDWYNVSLNQLYSLGCKTVIEKRGGLFKFLSKYYPKFPWDSEKLKTSGKSQQILCNSLETLFPGTQILQNYAYPVVNKEGTSKLIEFDVFIPDLNLAFEYQGEQHFHFHFIGGTPIAQQKRDEEKREQCKNAKITLVEVPYWWDMKKESLGATLNLARPELLKEYSKFSQIPIFSKLEKKQIGRNKVVLLSNYLNWNSTNINPSEWNITILRKGLRVYWDGDGKLYLKNGREIFPPSDFFPQGLPLEGILYADKGIKFPQSLRFLFEKENSSEWKNIHFQCLDSPLLFTMNLEERLQTLRSRLQLENNDMQELEKMISEYDLLLRKPNSEYYQQQSHFFLSKEKEEFVQVLQHLGAQRIQVKTIRGEFLTLDVMEKLPSIGTIISISRNSDSEATMKSIRPDRTWEDVLQEFHPVKYSLVYGNKLGIPQCRGCHKKFKDKNELRIQVIGTLLNSGLPPSACKVNFCVDVHCIERANSSDMKKRDILLDYPQFDGKIRITPEMQSTVQSSSMTATKDVLWIIE